MRNQVAWIWVELRYGIVSLGYWIRPYDMLADRRRWRWQPRQRCFGLWLPEAIDG